MKSKTAIKGENMGFVITLIGSYTHMWSDGINVFFKTAAENSYKYKIENSKNSS